MAFRRTRVKGQDMKTGEFAYLDQLIKDGFYPNIWVLPKNYEPPQPTGPSFQLPLEPIFNFSPPNGRDQITIPIIAQINISTGLTVLLPTSTGMCGIIKQNIQRLVTGISSNGLTGAIHNSISQFVTGIASQGVAGKPTTPSIASNGLTGIVSSMTNGSTTKSVSGIASNGLTGIVLNGTGFGFGGGFGSNGFGVA